MLAKFLGEIFNKYSTFSNVNLGSVLSSTPRWPFCFRTAHAATAPSNPRWYALMKRHARRSMNEGRDGRFQLRLIKGSFRNLTILVLDLPPILMFSVSESGLNGNGKSKRHAISIGFSSQWNFGRNVHSRVFRHPWVRQVDSGGQEYFAFAFWSLAVAWRELTLGRLFVFVECN